MSDSRTAQADSKRGDKVPSSSFQQKHESTENHNSLPKIDSKKVLPANIIEVFDDNNPAHTSPNRQVSDISSPLSPEKPKVLKVQKASTDKGAPGQTQQPKNPEEEKIQKKPRNPRLVKMEKFIDHWSVTAWMTLLTVYALFGDDIRLLAFGKSVDDIFFMITFITMIFFFIELFLSSIAKEGYFLGFYFWLDLIASLSLITDIGWIWNPILGTEDVSASNAEQASQLARAGRGARLGTRAGRVARIIRLIRLIRIVKLYKNANTAFGKKDEDPFADDNDFNYEDQSKPVDKNQNEQNTDKKEPTTQMQGPSEVANNSNFPASKSNKGEGESASILKVIPAEQENEENQQKNAKKEDDIVLPEESMVGKKLSDLTTRKVILIVLAMLFSVPILSVNTYIDIYSGYTFGLQLMAQYETGSRGFNHAFDSYILEATQERTPMIILNANGTIWEAGVNLDDLRTDEKEIVSFREGDFVAIYDLRPNTRLTAALGMGTTCFVCVVLATGALVFSQQTNDLVIYPIEQMIAKVNKISADPLGAAQEEENEALALEKMREEEEKKNKGKKKKDHKKEGTMETVVLEQTIVKIGALLALGFGEAGSKIISQNMENSGDVDPMVKGNKAIAIFGFCDIRNFTDATEVLQEDVMVFVNEIGEIVHGIVDSFSGAANKNIGDAFLLVWKFQEVDIRASKNIDGEDDIELDLDSPSVSVIADMSVLSFLKIISQIKRSRKLLKYKENKKLNERMPNYSVKMGFGLHVGWAIEGAIGSYYKIDASYLSPNVNMASRLEAATKQFGVPLLISGQLRDVCSQKSQDVMRHIDTVTVKGSIEPLRLFTVDVEFGHLELEAQKPKYTMKEQKILRVRARIKRDHLRKLCFDGEFKISNLYDTDKDLIEMRQMYKPTFNKGFDAYIAGDWTKAKEFLGKVEEIKGMTDFPTRNIMEVISNTNFKAPNGWKGYRELTEK